MKSKKYFSAAILTLLLLGCSDANSSAKIARDADANENVIPFEPTDSKMNEAIAKAKKSFSFFKENWQTMENDGYSLKFGLTTNDDSKEHIWFNPVSIEGTTIIAECANDPIDIPGLKLGDVRKLNEQDLSDWMIIAGNKCYGGYTVKVAFEEETNGETAPPFEFVE